VEIVEKKKALKNNVKSFEVTIVNNYDSSIQFSNTKNAIFKKSTTLLKEKRRFQFTMTLQAKLIKDTEDGNIYKEPYFSSRAMTVLNEDELLDALDRAEEQILQRIAT